MFRFALAVSLLAVPACIDELGSESDADLSDPDFECSPIEDLDTIALELIEGPPAAGTSVRTVSVSVTIPGSSCPDADPASGVTLAGTPLASTLNRAGTCGTFAGPLPAGVSEDPFLTFSNRFGQVPFYLGDLFAARGATPVGHQFISLPAGQEIVLAWSPANDLAIAYDATATFGGQPVTAVVMPDGVHLTLPADATGRQPLRVTLGTRGSFGSTFAYEVQQRVEYLATIAP